LRARWYSPQIGTFLSRDAWEGDELYPLTLNGWSYVEGNPTTRLDPTGLASEPRRPEQYEWDAYSDFSNEYSAVALDRLIDLRHHIIAASQRHGFVPSSICTGSASQYQLLYALGAIVYRESLGYDIEISSVYGVPKEIAARFGISGPDGIPSVGIAQMRPNTALELESAGFVYVPISDDGNWLFTNPHPFEAPNEWICPHCQRVDRLLTPSWAIEYVAANMEYAKTRDGYYEPQLPGKELIDEWHRMAGWHNRGIVNFANPFWTNVTCRIITFHSMSMLFEVADIRNTSIIICIIILVNVGRQ